jgi:hypothetical protein
MKVRMAASEVMVLNFIIRPGPLIGVLRGWFKSC